MPWSLRIWGRLPGEVSSVASVPWVSWAICQSQREGHSFPFGASRQCKHPVSPQTPACRFQLDGCYMQQLSLCPFPGDVCHPHFSIYELEIFCRRELPLLPHSSCSLALHQACAYLSVGCNPAPSLFITPLVWLPCPSCVSSDSVHPPCSMRRSGSSCVSPAPAPEVTASPSSLATGCARCWWCHGFSDQPGDRA